MKHCGTKQLETERLILRRFRPEDAAAMYQNWASDDEVTKYLVWPTHSSIEVSQYVINDWVNSYSKDDFYQWAIVPKENNDVYQYIRDKWIKNGAKWCGDHEKKPCDWKYKEQLKQLEGFGEKSINNILENLEKKE